MNNVPVPVQIGTNEQQIRVGLIVASMFTCGLALPIYVLWEILHKKG